MKDIHITKIETIKQLSHNYRHYEMRRIHILPS